MPNQNKIIWSEGLFIKPQHFQQETRYIEFLINHRLSTTSPYAYGFSELEINKEYLSFGKIALVRASGIMPDGAVFDIPGETPSPEPLVIDDASLANQTVFLALPLRADGVGDIQRQETNVHKRYIETLSEIKDTHSQDGNSTHLSTAQLNLRFMLESEDRSAYTCIAVTRIKEKRPDNTLSLDEDFFPTSVSLNAVPALSRFLGEVAGLIRARAEHLAERISAPSQAGVADVTDFMMLVSLNRLTPLFQHLTKIRDLHPERLYTEFTSACGELSSFVESGRLTQLFPAYNHAEPNASFKPLIDTLRRYLSTVLQSRAISIPIQKKPYGVYIAPLADRTLVESADFILAVRAQVNNDRIRTLFTQQTKVASLERIKELINLQLPGIPLNALPVAPRHLPYHAGFTYFQVDRSSPMWQMMKDTTGFGFHITGDLPELELQFWAVRDE